MRSAAGTRARPAEPRQSFAATAAHTANLFNSNPEIRRKDDTPAQGGKPMKPFPFGLGFTSLDRETRVDALPVTGTVPPG